jgi:hypothetical protein
LIILSDGITNLRLPDDLFWSDEMQWQPVEQSVERTLSGAMIVEAAARISGMPITLEPMDESSAWITRADYAVLNAWAKIPLKTLSLNYKNIVYRVMFRHHEMSGLSAKPVVFFSDASGEDHLIATIRLMEI